MTDTGQVPGEGLPESAGMVEQPGVPAHGAYAYLSETPVRDEDLLLPGSHGAWGHEVSPPAPEPVVEAVHQPGPHETAGRDTGSVDLGGVRHPDPSATPPAGIPAAVPPRRPLHLGPPIPDASASPVRSLADRGPADAPVRRPGPAAAGPEYLDVPQARETAPQGAAPWGAQPTVVASPVSAEAVVPGPDQQPAGAAPYGPDMSQVPADGQGAPIGQVPTGGRTPQTAGSQSEAAGVAVPVAATDAVGAPEDESPRPEHAGVAVSESGALQPGGAVAGVVPDPGHASAGEVQPEAAAVAPVPPDTGQVPDGGQIPEAGPRPEGAGPAHALDAAQVTEGAQVSPAGEAPEDAVEAVQAAVPAETVAAAETAHTTGTGPEGAQAGPVPVHAPEAGQAVAEQTAPAEAVRVPAAEGDTAEVPVAAGEPADAPQPQSPAADAPEAAPVPPAAEATATPVRVTGQPEAPAAAEAGPLGAAEMAAAPAADHIADPAAQDADAPQPADAAVPAADAAVLAVDAAVPAATAAPETAGPQPAEQDAATPADPAQGEHTQGAPLRPGVPLQSQPGQTLGEFVPVEGSVPTTPHLAPTPPHPIVVPADQLPPEEPAVTVPAPRDGDAPAASGEEPAPEAVQHADDLDTHGADAEETPEQNAAEETEALRPTGPAAPGYDEAEREAVLRVMRERRDIRNGFRADPIPHEVLRRVLEAAHTAPSVGHSQPWDFVVIRSAETRQAMHELAMRQREAYAKSLPKGRAKQFKELKIEAILDTPVNIVVTADPTRGGRHTLGRHTQPQMAPYSSALAVENLWLAARAEGLGVGWVSFFDEREMVRVLGLPEHLEIVAYLCVGYVDEFPDEPELMQAGWSKRRPLSWVVHEETYGRRALPGEDPHDLLAETVAQIRPLDAKALGEAWERQKRMTKPAGALGMLEIISAQLCGLSRQCPPPIPEPAAVAVFAGDHGVHAQGVTPWPQEVTAQMVANFLGGGAVCNAFAAQVGAEVCVVDVGVAADLPATPGLLPRKVRAGTSDMTAGPAMTREEAKQAIEVGIETARDLVAAGNKALLTGEMGIANTTASAALISVFTGADPAEVTGRGTGINDETLARKTDVVRRALDLHQPDPADPIGVLAAIGGFEHAAMVGLLLGGASLRTPVILDGVSAGAAALVARAIAPEVLAACIAGHRSAEPGHVAALNKLGLRPLVDLDLRLGEGTGALLALPLVQSTARAMHEVATFDSAGVTEK
ncbi:nicotinate-nucleotide--dimethylbenzimidazole phosphoribosyltransferase [Streptomyces sp. NPDC014889]|uniref:nicotinate-nucleotide--dimethylbenzimidazole phosphoribosyltransferase n=1 Tax=Streptomyces sp. NPDC014889 TaxID=3364928 RepID=UPI0036F9BBDD